MLSIALAVFVWLTCGLMRIQCATLKEYCIDANAPAGYSKLFYYRRSCYGQSSTSGGYTTAQTHCNAATLGIFGTGNLAMVFTTKPVKAISTEYQALNIVRINLNQLNNQDEPAGNFGVNYNGEFHHVYEHAHWKPGQPDNYGGSEDSSTIKMSAKAINDSPVGTSQPWFCEWREPELTHQRSHSANRFARIQTDVIAPANAQFNNYTTTRIGCALACMEHFMCNSFAHNHGTKHCIVQLAEDPARASVAAQGYNWFEED